MGKMPYETLEKLVHAKGGKLLYRIYNAITGEDEIFVQMDGKNKEISLDELLK